MTSDLYISIRSRLHDLIAGSIFEGKVYFVGGCCRDEIMGVEIKDIDIAVAMRDGGILLAEWLKSEGFALPDIVTFPEYGIAQFRLADYPDIELEAVNTRKESYPDPASRNPVTEYGTLEQDCLRRDLTINALYYDITEMCFVDVTGKGLADIRDQVVRTPVDPDRVYYEDPLRILRCIRFATRFGWEIESGTYEAMKRNVYRMEILSQERLKDEFCMMILSENCVKAVELLNDCGCLGYILLEIEYGVISQKTLQVLKKVAELTPDLCVRLSALLCDGDINIQSIMRRMMFHADEIRKVQFLVAHHDACKDWGPLCEHMSDASLRRLQYQCGNIGFFEELLMLVHAENLTRNSGESWQNQSGLIYKRTLEMIGDGTAMFGFAPWLSGRDVMSILGIGPGPEVKACLDYLLELAFDDPTMPQDLVINRLCQYKNKR